MNSPQYRFDLFISYSDADKTWVREWLLPRLEKADLRVCLDYRDFDVGVPRLENLGRAVRHSRKTLLVLTPNWVKSNLANFVSLLAQTRDPSGLRQSILPLMLQECEPPTHVSIFSYADFTQTDQWESQLIRVIDAINDKISLPKKLQEQLKIRKSITSSQHNLPAQLTRFIGREQVKQEISELITSTRLLTLTGAPGTGKTRLAQEMVGNLLDSYRDGIWWVELANVEPQEKSDIIQQTVALALGVREEPGKTLYQTLLEYLRPKQLLLFIDNCEHLIEPCVTLITSLLQSCPYLTVLATSREALLIPGELLKTIPPLSLPAQQQLPALSELKKYEAVALFVERARLSHPGFKLTDKNALMVTEICQQLEGLPLAIELIAAWMKTLSIEQMTIRMKKHHWLLDREARTVQRHQQTLRHTLDWSYSFLSHEEGILFNRLSVFTGGCTLEAAEAVTVGGQIETYKVFDLLALLVNKSLVTVEENSDASVRYRLLEPLRQYGQEKFTTPEEMTFIQHNHAVYYLKLAKEIEPKLSGSDQAQWERQLEQEYGNLRKALYWAQELGEAEYFAQLAGSLGRFWWLRSYFSEGCQWLEQALSFGDVIQMVTQAKVLYHLGKMAVYQGDMDQSKEHLEKSLTIYREIGDQNGIAKSLYQLGLQSYSQAKFSEAEEIITESLKLFQLLRNIKGSADSLESLGVIAVSQGDYVKAMAHFENSLPLFEELGHQFGIANAHLDIGVVLRRQEKYVKAQKMLEKSLAIYKEINYRVGIARSLENLGSVHKYQANYLEAIACFKESMIITHELGIKVGIAFLLEDFGSLAVTQSQLKRGVQLFSAATNLRQMINAPRTPYDLANYNGDMAIIREHLEEKVFARCWNKGQDFELEEAVQYALAEIISDY